MSNKIKQSLEKINSISRQLVSRLLSVQQKIKEETIVNDSNKDKTNTDDLITDDELTKLITQREDLIQHVFEQNTKNEIAVELTLLNEMVLLDNEISTHSTSCKNALAEQVIRLKKSKKVKKSYQKY